MRFARSCLAFVVGAALVAAGADAFAAVPVAGFQPLLGIGLTDEFKDEDDDLFYFIENRPSPGGNWLGPGTSPYFDVALLDTGAAVSLITHAADAAFNIQAEGFRGTEFQQIGGATGIFFATINDPLGIYATGLAGRTATAPLGLDQSAMIGQHSVSLLTLPVESDLPNIVGLSFASQYATSIRADQPQIFELNGRTVRTPQVEFAPLGSGGGGIVRRAPLSLNPSQSFLIQPSYLFNFLNILEDLPLTDNPTAPTNIQGGLFLNVSVSNGGAALNNSSFFFDTGADITVVSELNAVQLGFDPVLDTPEFTVSILGSGGTIEAVPGFFADQLTIATVGGSFVVDNVPIIVLDVADPSNPGNVVPGILGTNVLSGRNLVIDPNPSLGGGGVGPSLYISDPVTTAHSWASAAPSADWHSASAWGAPGVPETLWVANVNHVSGGEQRAVVSADSTIWELNVAGGSDSAIAVQVEEGVTLTTFSGINLYEGGGLHLRGGKVDAQFIEVLGGSISGAGTIEVGNGPIAGQVEIRDGELAVGDGIGKLDLIGRFAMGAGATVSMELGGTTAGTLYDQLAIEGVAVLEGTLEVALAGGFMPVAGDSFTLMTATERLGGAFDTLILPTGFNWDVAYTATSVVLSVLDLGLAGDYNGDGTVDAADFTLWRDSFGQSGTGLAADGDRSGTIDDGDYLVWKNHFGQTLGNGTGAADNLPVPEPAALILLLLGGALVSPRVRFSGSRSRRSSCSS